MEPTILLQNLSGGYFQGRRQVWRIYDDSVFIQLLHNCAYLHGTWTARNRDAEHHDFVYVGPLLQRQWVAACFASLSVLWTRGSYDNRVYSYTPIDPLRGLNYLLLLLTACRMHRLDSLKVEVSVRRSDRGLRYIAFNFNEETTDADREFYALYVIPALQVEDAVVVDSVGPHGVN